MISIFSTTGWKISAENTDAEIQPEKTRAVKNQPSIIRVTDG
jgi:hypothetical protein